MNEYLSPPNLQHQPHHSNNISPYEPEGKYKIIQKNFILPEDKFYGQSSYNDSYNAKNSLTDKSQKKITPRGQLALSNAPFEGNTSYINDYAGKTNDERLSRAPLPRNYVIPEGKFEGNSNYQANYVQGRMEKVKKYAPEGQLKVGGGVFEASSSYEANYNGKGKPERANRTLLAQNQVLPEGKFEGNSLYSASYAGGQTEKLKQYKPEGQLKIGGNFHGNSTYGADYENKRSIQRTEMPSLPRNYVLPQGKFEGYSNYNQDYVPNSYQRLQKISPEGQLKLGGRFQGQSSYGNDYGNKVTEKRIQRAPQIKNHVFPEGRFNGNSAYNNDFVQGRIQPIKQFKPTNQLKVGQGKFEAESSYGYEYSGKGNAVRQERISYPQNQVLPEGKFDGDTLYHESYIPSKLERPQQFRPQQQLKVGGKFEGKSTYVDSYIKNGNQQYGQKELFSEGQISRGGQNNYH